MKKIAFSTIFLVGLFLLGSLIYTKGTLKENIPNTRWERYSNSELGFYFNYPSGYILEEQPLPEDVDWNTLTLLTIYDPKNTSTYEFNVPVMRIIIQRQPLLFGQEKIFTNIQEYSNWRALSDTNFNGKLISINTVDSLYIKLPQGDAENARIDAYYFIHKELLFYTSFNTNDKYYKNIVQTIHFK